MRIQTVVSFAAAMLCACMLYAMIGYAPTSIANHPWLDVWLEVSIVLLVGILCALFAAPLRDPLRFELAVGVVSLFLTATLALMLKNTPYTVGAVTGDQRFYTYAVTKAAAYPGFVDAIYRDLPTFYPPLYYYGLGRFAALIHVEPFHIMKLGLLATVFAMPYLGAWLWRRIVGYQLAVAAAFVLLVYQQWFKPAEWLTLVLFVPWWLYWVEDIAQHRPGKQRPTSGWAQATWWLWGGLLGGLIFQSYYYWFFIGGISLALHLIIRLWQKGKNPVWQLDLGHAIGMLLSAALFSSIYWAPYLYSMYRTGGWDPLQNRWLSDGKIPLPLPFLSDSIEGLFLLGGLLYLAVSAGSNRVSRSLLSLVIAVYIWAGLGYVGILTDHPLLTFRAYPVIDYLLALGAILALLRLWQEKPWAQWLPASTLPFARVAPTLLLICLLFFGQNTTDALLKDENIQKAQAAQAPQAQLAALDKLTQQQYLNKAFLLGNSYADLMAYRPFFTFIPWTATFSHPAGRLHDRLDFLQRLAATSDPALFALALMNNRYTKLNYILLDPKGDAWEFSFKDLNFPDRTISRVIKFDKSLLAPPYFQAQSEAGLTLFTPVDYIQNPFTTDAAAQVASASLTNTLLAYDLTGTFGPHLDWPNQALLRTQATERLLKTDLTTLSLDALLDLTQAADGPLAAKANSALLNKLPEKIDAPLIDRAGAQKLHVLGYQLQPSTADPTKMALALYFQVLAPLEQDYTLWLHANTTETQKTFDHEPMVQTSAWRTGKIYRDVTVLNAEPGAYQLSFGLWRSEEDIRLTQPNGDVGVALGEQVLR